MSRGPIACGALYEAVIDRAGGGCECDDREGWGCARAHRFTGHWCSARYGADEPLIVAARDPQLPLHRITNLPPGELVALCRACYTRRTNSAKKAAAEDEQQLDLFAGA